MRTLIFSGIFLFVCMTSKAQVTQSANSLNDLAQIGRQKNKIEQLTEGKMSLSNIEGSIYLNQDFIQGIIYDRSRDKKITAYIRYRILDDMFEVKKTARGKQTMTLKRGKNYEVKYNNKHFVFLRGLPIKVNGTYNGYAWEMIKSEDGASLYKRYAQTFHEAERQGRSSYGVNQGRGRPHVETDTYYFTKIDGRLYWMEKSSNDVVNNLPAHKAQLRSFIEKHDLDFRGDNADYDFARLINYYNSLE